jgi:hypothetical protein
MTRLFSRISTFSLAWRQTILAGSVLAMLLPLAALAFRLHARLGVEAACVAASACWLGAATALGGAHGLRAPSLVLVRTLFSTVTRLSLPLGVGLMVYLLGAPLVQAGFFYYLLTFYPFVLAVETMLSLPQADTSPAILTCEDD